MMQAKDWKDCGCKAAYYSRATGLHYCTRHIIHVCGWQYEMAAIKN